MCYVVALHHDVCYSNIMLLSYCFRIVGDWLLVICFLIVSYLLLVIFSYCWLLVTSYFFFLRIGY